jgi:hypothetical protein
MSTHRDSAYYFGCWRVPGHHFHEATPSGVPIATSTYPEGWSAAKLDAGPHTPPRREIRRGVFVEETEGVAAVYHAPGGGRQWTILAFWDRTFDHRPGSHSTYLVEGTLSFEEAAAAAREAFPEVWARYAFDVREQS